MVQMEALMKYDIIIPHFGLSEVNKLALKCLESIREFSQDYRLIWVDNTGEPSDGIVSELMAHKNTTVIRMTENVGFVRAVNIGIQASSAPFVVVMNNDTEARPNWLSMLSAPLTGKNGLSGPRTTTPYSWQGRLVPETNRSFVLSKTAMLAFFCTMFRRDVFDTVGLLDEDFGVGLGDDDEFCYRVHRAGFDLVWVPGLVIPHWHRSTFRELYTKEEIAELQRSAMKLFREKLNCEIPSLQPQISDPRVLMIMPPS